MTNLKQRLRNNTNKRRWNFAQRQVRAFGKKEALKMAGEWISQAELAVKKYKDIKDKILKQ